MKSLIYYFVAKSCYVKYDLVLIKHALMHYHQRDVTARYEEAFQRINVRRSDLFVCAFSKPTFDVRKFNYSAAVDDGGSQRESFSPLANEIFLLSGMLAISCCCCANNTGPEYYVIWKMLSVSLIQGSQQRSTLMLLWRYCQFFSVWCCDS